MSASPDRPAGSALDDFVASRIGGEQLYDTGDGSLVTDTAVQAAAVVGELVDSPSVASARVRPLTRLLRGAVLTLYALVHTLNGSGLRRGLGLLLLAVGGALLAVDLLTGATPQWLATAGFAVLLGGLAYAAIAARMLEHALLLATPVVPLATYALSQSPDQGSPGGGSVVVVVGLVVTLLVMGSARARQQTPWGWLRRDRHWVRVLEWAALVAALLVLVVRGRSYGADALAGVVAVVVALAIVAGLAGVGRLAVGVRRAELVRPRAVAQQRYVAAVWACCYGAVYAAAAAVLATTGPVADWVDPVTYSLAGLAVACNALSVVLAVRRRRLTPAEVPDPRGEVAGAAH